MSTEGKAQAITADNFAALASSGVALLDFWAQWCKPCLALSPVMDELAKEFADKAVVGKVDCDAERDLSVTFKIRAMPTVVILKDGEVVARMGKASKKEYAEALTQALNR